MDLKNIPDIDPKELTSLIEEARKAQDYSSPRLGELVSCIVKKVITKDRFIGYTEDWQAEMFSEGCLSIFKAISNRELTIKDSFNYLFTTAYNELKQVVEKLNDNIPAETADEIESDPFYMRNKRRLIRGFFDKKAEQEVVDRVFKKQPLIKNAVGISARCFAENFTEDELDSLIAKARSVRG